MSSRGAKRILKECRRHQIHLTSWVKCIGIGARGARLSLGRHVNLRKRRNMCLGRDVTIGDFCRVSGGCQRNSLTIGDGTFVHEYCILRPFCGHIKIGRDCTLNPFSIVYGYGGVDIGDDVRIAAHTVIVASSHNFGQLDVPIRTQGLSAKGIRIDNDVWIGTNCTILDGVHVGAGAIIGAGSVVTKGVRPYSIVAGSPATILRMRAAHSGQLE
jgi:acetyltransferase-like isoleucine patch superfamily enzyme